MGEGANIPAANLFGGSAAFAAACSLLAGAALFARQRALQLAAARKALLPPAGGGGAGAFVGGATLLNPLVQQRPGGGAQPSRAGAGKKKRAPSVDAGGGLVENPLRAFAGAAAAAGLAAAKPAPQGWAARWSASRGGRVCYVHLGSGERSWKLPAAAEAGADGAPPQLPGAAVGEAGASPPAPPTESSTLVPPQAEAPAPPSLAEGAPAPPPEAEEAPTPAPAALHPDATSLHALAEEEALPAVLNEPLALAAPLAAAPLARLNVKEWLVLKNAAEKGVPGFSSGNKLPQGWVKRFSPSGAPEFVHEQSATVVASAGEVVEWQEGAAAKEGAL